MVGVGRETTHTVSPRTRPRRAKVAALISRVFRLTNLQNVPYRAPLAEETLVCVCVRKYELRRQFRTIFGGRRVEGFE